MPISNEKTTWQKIIAAGAEALLFPKRCVFCKKYGSLVCCDCQSLMEISGVHCRDHSRKYLDDIYSACPYENRFVQKVIRVFKYEPFYKEMANPLAQMIADHFKLAEFSFDFGESTIVSVPLAQKRLRWRGFNQAEELARNLGIIWDLPVAENCLVRPRETLCQADLSGKERRENIKGAFACPNPIQIKKRSVLIVDDVVTTGATMEECARILKKNGALSVIGIAFARTEL